MTNDDSDKADQCQILLKRVEAQEEEVLLPDRILADTGASDIDLCIVMGGHITSPERIQICRELMQDILEITDYEVDLFICGEDEWQKNHQNSGVMIGKVFREGELLYGG